MVARAAPDGLTLLVAPSGSMVINPAVYSKLPYDPLKSYELISNIALYHLVLSVSASQPFKSVKELVEWGKANPDKANYASTSAVFQLTSELFNQKTGAKFQHIPFKGGAELVTAVLTGQATMTFADAGPAMPQFKAGTLRPLASTGATRLPELPDVPTLAEVGIDGVVVEGFIGLAAPKGTPAADREEARGRGHGDRQAARRAGAHQADRPHSRRQHRSGVPRAHRPRHSEVHGRGEGRGHQVRLTAGRDTDA